ncbi:peptidoglycan-recognition protein 3 [Anabrus simplex]|uniref:peptidoglycan-recognition protein 3 n=1 Tax=Anabrus simplex TaxID=316456 RepID=UPI0035A2F2BB
MQAVSNGSTVQLEFTVKKPAEVGVKQCEKEQEAFKPLQDNVVLSSTGRMSPPQEVRYGCMLWLMCMATSLLFVLLLTRLVLLTTDPTVLIWNKGDNPDTDNLTLPDLVIVPKDVWAPPHQRMLRLYKPVSLVGVGDTSGKTCYNSTECISLLEEMEQLHINGLHEPQIGWNFLIGGDGIVYEGRGWDLASFFQASRKKSFLGVCFLGNYNNSELLPTQLVALQELMHRGMTIRKVAHNYKLMAVGHGKFTDEPSKNLLKVVNSWPKGCVQNCWIKKETLT